MRDIVTAAHKTYFMLMDPCHGERAGLVIPHVIPHVILNLTSPSTVS